MDIRGQTKLNFLAEILGGTQNHGDVLRNYFLGVRVKYTVCPCPGCVPVRVVSCPGYVPVRVMSLSGLCLSRLRPVQVTSCPGCVLSGLRPCPGCVCLGCVCPGCILSGLCLSGLRRSTQPLTFKSW